jgi:hypothetical protein
MKLSLKFAVPVACAAVASLLGVVESADALSCAPSGFIPWTTQTRCPAPDQNRGFGQGAGIINTNGRVLSISVTNGFGNTGGIERGFNSNFVQICSVNGVPGQFNTSPSGACSSGSTHRLTISFN